MRNIKIKICGITSSTILDCCNELNINFFGLIFYRQSPRNIEIEKAKNLIKYQNKKNSIPVGVFVNHNFKDLSEIIQSINKIGFKAKRSLQKGIEELIKGYQVIKRNQYSNI